MTTILYRKSRAATELVLVLPIIVGRFFGALLEPEPAGRLLHSSTFFPGYNHLSRCADMIPHACRRGTFCIVLGFNVARPELFPYSNETEGIYRINK